MLDLNTQTLIGFTDKRGKAWHYVAEHQIGEGNHFDGAVPFGAVERLFGWRVVTSPVLAQVPADLTEATGMAPDGTPVRTVTDPSRKVLLRSDTGAVLGVHSARYGVHEYSDGLLRNVSTILGDSVQIGSAGLLDGGAKAWVQIETPETLTTPEGVDIRPHLLAVSSHDGTIPTTYKRVVTVVVCDNTCTAALGESGAEFRIKHTRYSALRLTDARQALGVLESIADDFSAQVKALCAVTVTDRQWFAFLDEVAPVPDEPGRARTTAGNRRDALTALYRRDERVAPWSGTAYGVLQAVNTEAHWLTSARGSDTFSRNMSRAMSGGVEKLDRETLSTLGRVLSNV
jgi:phage/plasmid-like protein (TIGR03299 family)